MIKIHSICAIQSQVINPCGVICKDKDWINLKRRATRNGYSLEKQVLVDAIKKEIRRRGPLKRRYDIVLGLSLSCGSGVSYKTWDDIPNKSVPCPCGNPTHWLIKYGKGDHPLVTLARKLKEKKQNEMAR